MGNWFSNTWNTLLGIKDVRIVMVGLDGAGKTTILYYLKMNKFVETISPSAMETILYKNLSIISWDLGRQDKVRVLWKHFYKNTDGVIFIVDSNDKDRFENASDELKKLLAEEDLKDAPLLIMANKQDLTGAISPNDITEKLGLQSLKDRQWLVQGTSASTGQGIREGLDWMVKTLCG